MHAPIGLARRFHQIALGVLADVHAENDLRPLEFGVMIHLHDTPGIDQNTLVERMALDRTSVSAMVYRLEQLGLSERSVNGADRRARALRLSAAGRALHTIDNCRMRWRRRSGSWWPCSSLPNVGP